ncbi:MULTISPECIES: hypothetical protein [Pseudomonas]|uniref:hypothetical protein n=1 Tax=Pseudomonas TaxID=286 RepID=UPI0018E6FCB3|nr:hypothetical protein [Pseudomonas carnis]MBJ2210799.1 hypothetical protein [Pseudomonas carnis]
MSKFKKNPLKLKFLEQFPISSLASSDIRSRCKFNLSFFDDSQQHGSAFDALDSATLSDILSKIKAFTRNDLNYWRNERCGGSGLKIFTDYTSFPKKSNFSFPKYIPHDVRWGRFRLENLMRLVGFTIPGAFENNDKTNNQPYDMNTFYLVFIDLEHNFYISEKK